MIILQSESPSNTIHQLCQTDAECFCDPLDIPQGKIPFSPFNPADVGPVQLAGIRKLLLRVTLLSTQFPDPLSKSQQNIFSFCHASI